MTVTLFLEIPQSTSTDDDLCKRQTTSFPNITEAHNIACSSAYGALQICFMIMIMIMINPLMGIKTADRATDTDSNIQREWVSV